MKFLCLCHYETARFAACTPEDFEEVGRICKPRDEALHASGHLVAVGSFVDSAQYAVIRATEEGPAVSRGPYAQTQEPFGAFFIVEADTIEKAIEIASLHPGAHLARQFGGGIEVRPCETYAES